MEVRTLRNLVAALSLAAFAPIAAAVFQAGMSVEQIEAEVKIQLAANRTLDQIAAAALAANLDAAVVTAAMIHVTGTNNAAGVVTAMLRAGAPLDVVVQTALQEGAGRGEVTRGAIAAGVSPQNIAFAIANAIEVINGQTGTLDRSINAITPSGAGGGGGTASPS
jgi:hypothetical protein